MLNAAFAMAILNLISHVHLPSFVNMLPKYLKRNNKRCTVQRIKISWRRIFEHKKGRGRRAWRKLRRESFYRLFPFMPLHVRRTSRTFQVILRQRDRRSNVTLIRRSYPPTAVGTTMPTEACITVPFITNSWWFYSKKLRFLSSSIESKEEWTNFPIKNAYLRLTGCKLFAPQ